MSAMDDAVNKMMKHPPSMTHVLAVSGKFIGKLDTVFDVMRFSKLNLLLCVTARVFQFMKNLELRAAIKDQSIDNGEVSSVELNNAELHWLHYIQSQSFEHEFWYLQGDHTSAAPIYVRQFELFIDNNGLLRCQ